MVPVNVRGDGAVVMFCHICRQTELAAYHQIAIRLHRLFRLRAGAWRRLQEAQQHLIALLLRIFFPTH